MWTKSCGGRYAACEKLASASNAEARRFRVVRSSRRSECAIRLYADLLSESASRSQSVAIRLTGCPKTELATTPGGRRVCRATDASSEGSAGVDPSALGYSPIAECDFRLWQRSRKLSGSPGSMGERLQEKQTEARI